MRPYAFSRADTVAEAMRQAGPGTAYLAGGTTLVEVMTPDHVVDIDRLPLRGIDVDRLSLRVGALERMSDVAAHHDVRRHATALAEALDLSASGQLRNMASIGGNLLQRTRCGYFRDVTTPCNKREPGTGCSMIAGFDRAAAVLGRSEHCVATNPSDMAVALVALDAQVHLASTRGTRTVPVEDFYALPGATPHVENVLRPGELVVEVSVPRPRPTVRSTYLKVRDRQSYEFALSSAAVLLDLRGREIRTARVAVGGMGTVPWRLPAVEAALVGRRATTETFETAVAGAAEGASTGTHNTFKPALLRRTLVRALTSVTERR